MKTFAALQEDRGEKAFKQAIQMGLKYAGFGYWKDPQTGETKFKTENDTLVPVEPDIESEKYTGGKPGEGPGGQDFAGGAGGAGGGGMMNAAGMLQMPGAGGAMPGQGIQGAPLPGQEKARAERNWEPGPDGDTCVGDEGQEPGKIPGDAFVGRTNYLKWTAGPDGDNMTTITPQYADDVVVKEDMLVENPINTGSDGVRRVAPPKPDPVRFGNNFEAEAPKLLNKVYKKESHDGFVQIPDEIATHRNSSMKTDVVERHGPGEYGDHEKNVPISVKTHSDYPTHRTKLHTASGGSGVEGKRRFGLPDSTDIQNPIHRSFALLFGEQDRNRRSVMPDDLGYDLRDGDLDQFGRLKNFGQFKDIVGAEDAEQFFKYLNDPKNKKYIYDNFVRQRKFAPYDQDPYRDHDPSPIERFLQLSIANPPQSRNNPGGRINYRGANNALLTEFDMSDKTIDNMLDSREFQMDDKSGLFLSDGGRDQSVLDIFGTPYDERNRNNLSGLVSGDMETKNLGNEDFPIRFQAHVGTPPLARGEYGMKHLKDYPNSRNREMMDSGENRMFRNPEFFEGNYGINESASSNGEDAARQRFIDTHTPESEQPKKMGLTGFTTKMDRIRKGDRVEPKTSRPVRGATENEAISALQKMSDGARDEAMRDLQSRGDETAGSANRRNALRRGTRTMEARRKDKEKVQQMNDAIRESGMLTEPDYDMDWAREGGGQQEGEGSFGSVAREGSAVVKEGMIGWEELQALHAMKDHPNFPTLMNAEFTSPFQHKSSYEQNPFQQPNVDYPRISQGESFDDMFPTAGGRFAMSAMEGEPLADFMYSYGDNLPREQKEYLQKRIHDLRADMHRRGIAHQDMHNGNMYVDAMENEDGNQEVMDVNFLDLGLATRDRLKAFMEAMGGTGEGLGDYQLSGPGHYNHLPGFMQTQFDYNRDGVVNMMDEHVKNYGRTGWKDNTFDDDSYEPFDETELEDLLRGGIRIPDDDLQNLSEQFGFLADDNFLEEAIETLYQGFGTDLSKYQDS